jgi:hypothetical protein
MSTLTLGSRATLWAALRRDDPVGLSSTSASAAAANLRAIASSVVFLGEVDQRQI